MADDERGHDMAALILYYMVRTAAVGICCRSAFDSIQVATSDDVVDIQRRGSSYWLTGVLWGLYLSWTQVESVVLRALT